MTQKHQRLQLNFCVTKTTWHELPDYLLLAQRMKTNVWVSVVTAPPRTSVFGLGRPALQRILATLRGREGELLDLTDRLRDIWQSVLRTIENAVCDMERVRFGFGIARAVDLADRGRLRSARAVARQVKVSNPFHDTAQNLLEGCGRQVVDSRVWQAERHYEAGDMAEAEPLLLAAAQKDECEPGIFVRLAGIRLSQGRPELGLAHLQELVQRIDLSTVGDHFAQSVAAIKTKLERAFEKAEATAGAPPSSQRGQSPDAAEAAPRSGTSRPCSM